MVSIVKILHAKTFFQYHTKYICEAHTPNTLVSMFVNLSVWDFEVSLLVP